MRLSLCLKVSIIGVVSIVNSVCNVVFEGKIKLLTFMDYRKKDDDTEVSVLQLFCQN